MKIIKNKSLKQLNTFNVDISTKEYINIIDKKELVECYKRDYFKKKFLVLGGGSNTLFVNDYDGLIIHINIDFLDVREENNENILVKVGAGKIWDDFVKWSVENSYLGLQNLANIPGSCGATPVQNVGAYGVEVKDFITEVEFFNIKSGNFEKLNNKECNFSYRNSIFKKELKDIAIITSVKFRLSKWEEGKEVPEKFLEYKGITDKLDSNYKRPFTIKKIYNAVVEIRNEKLPKVGEYGSCGSTFANPIITKEKYKELLKSYFELPSYEIGNENLVKIPAAYILEQLGWKNKKIGKCGTWVKHPLIVTNYENASGEEIYNLITQIQKVFFEKTGVKLDTEINIIF